MATAQPLGKMIIEMGLDDTNFARGMKGVNQQVKTSMTEMKAHLNVMGRSGNEVDKLKARQTGLTGVIDAQNKKVQLAKEKYEACKAAVEGNADATQEQKDALIKAQNEYVKAVGELGSYENQLKEVNIKLMAMESTIYQVGSSLENFGTKMTIVGDRISAVGMTLTTGLTMPLIALGGYILKTTADFDEGMSKVSAISGATGNEFDELRLKAREMGEKTKFSATEAASAMEYMAMAGWKTSDMLDGIDGVMNLAAASGEDLARTSDIVTDALTAFGLQASDSAHFSDILAAASSNANTNVSMMGETFKYCAPVAGALGFSAEDTAEAIGLMGNAGIKASQAGTAMRKILTEMSGDITITGSRLGEYTVQTTNADGSMRDLSEILADCRVGFSQLTEAEQASEAQAIAGKTAMSGFLAVMNAAPSDIEKLSGAIKNCDGTAEEMAKTMQDNLKGQMTILGSQLQELAISFGDILMPKVRDIVSKIQGFVDKLNKMDDGTKKTIVNVALFTATVGPATLVVGKLTSGIGKLVTGIGKGMQSFALWAAKITHTTTAQTAQIAATKASTTATATNTTMNAKNTAGLLAKTVKTIADTVASKAHAAAEKLRTLALVASTGTLVTEVTALNASIASKIKNTASVIAHTVAEKARSLVTGASTGQLSLQTVATVVQTTATNACAIATGVLKAALVLLTGPIGVIIALVGALVVGVTAAVKWFNRESEAVKQLREDTEELANTTDELVDSLDGSQKAYKDTQTAIKAEAGAAKELTDKIKELSEVENKTAAQKMELASYVEALNGSMADLNLQYDEQADCLSMTTDEIYNQIEAFEKQAEAQAAQERLTEILKEQITVGEQLEQVQKKIADAKEDDSFKSEKGIEVIQGLIEQEETLKETKESLGESYAYVTDLMVKLAEEEAEAVNGSVGSQILTMESLSDKQKEVVESLQEKWRSYSDAATNMFDTLTDKTEISIAEMTKNLEENQRIVGEWSSNIAILAERGVDQGLLETLRNAGPESAGTVKELVNASDAELMRLSDVFSQGGDVATNALKTSFDTSGVPESAMGLVTQTEQTMERAIATANFGGLGSDTVEGYVQGIEESALFARGAGEKIGEEACYGATGFLDINSPSRVFKGYGENTIEGFVLGVVGKQGELNNVMETTMKLAADAATNTMKSSMKQMTGITDTVFNALPQAAKTSMSGVNNAINTGMTNVKSTVSNNMKSVESSVKGGLQTVKTQFSNGLSGISSDVSFKMTNINNIVKISQGQISNNTSSWMSGLRASVSLGINTIVTIASSAASRITAAFNISGSMQIQGTHAMNGFINGLSAKESAVYAKANKIANNVTRTISKALDIHSPSRVLKRLGEYTMEGFGLGIEGMQEYITEVVGDTAGIVSAGFNNMHLAAPVLTVDTEAVRKINETLELTNNIDADSTGSKLDKLIDLLSKILITEKQSSNKKLQAVINNYLDKDLISYGLVEGVIEEVNRRQKSSMKAVGV